MTNSQLALLMAQAIIAAQANAGAFQVEEVSAADEHAAYEGAKIVAASGGFQCLDLYLCDDEPNAPVWMLDSYDGDTGDCNPVPFTAASLEAALAWLVQA